MPGLHHRKILNPARSLLLAVVLFSASGCAPDVPEGGFHHESGMSFVFPEGWSVPSRQEWKNLKLGDDQTLITIMDESRSAGFSIVPVNLGPDEQFVLNILDDEPAARAVMFVESIDAAGPGSYERYELIGKNYVNFADAPMAEIVFQGRKPGKALNRNRLLALTTMSDFIIMFLFSAPVDELESFQPDFDFIESTWSWND